MRIDATMFFKIFRSELIAIIAGGSGKTITLGKILYYTSVWLV